MYVIGGYHSVHHVRHRGVTTLCIMYVIGGLPLCTSCTSQGVTTLYIMYVIGGYHSVHHVRHRGVPTLYIMYVIGGYHSVHHVHHRGVTTLYIMYVIGGLPLCTSCTSQGGYHSVHHVCISCMSQGVPFIRGSAAQHCRSGVQTFIHFRKWFGLVIIIFSFIPKKYASVASQKSDIISGICHLVDPNPSSRNPSLPTEVTQIPMATLAFSHEDMDCNTK